MSSPCVRTSSRGPAGRREDGRRGRELVIPRAFAVPLRFLRGSATRLVLTVGAVASGVALVCAIDLANRAVLTAFTEVVDAMAGRASLQVVAGEGGLMPEDVAATVAAVPGVTLAVPVVSA